MLSERRYAEPVKAVLFDFDGTISTLRCGWEEVMRPLMAETLASCGCPGDSADAMARRYIAESAGIQTIYQMKWLAERVRELGADASDPWAYKDEYNRRLMLGIDAKRQMLIDGKKKPEDFLLAGAQEFLRALRASQVRILVASGTDHPDVVSEAKLLQVYGLFDEIKGAPPREERCSKEAVLRDLADKHNLRGDQVAVIGDGKVEIALGGEMGMRTIGIASDEVRRSGINPVKRERLSRAGADVIFGDFLARAEMLRFLGIESKKEA